ncbi:MAG: hypothetical protein Q4F74_01925 [Synergistaceae bacterium]|nr:hypothetical protein [Synergistaceae bacterium]
MDAEHLALQSAKAKFAASMEAANPRNVIAGNPINSVGIAVLAGILLVTSGKRLSRGLFPGPRLIASLIKQFL